MTTHISITALQWLIMALGAFGIGLSKTGIAGFGIVAVALFALAFPASMAKVSVGVVLPVLIVGDLCAVSMFRGKVVWRHLIYLFPAAGIGVGLGFLAIGHIQGKDVAPLIGAILLVLTAVQLWRRTNDKRQGKHSGPSDVAGVLQSPVTTAVMGVSAGFTTMVANAAGPVMVLYLLGTRLPKVEFIGTGAWFFFILNMFKVPFSARLGMISLDTLPIDLRLAPMVLVGAFTGRWLVHRIDQRLFENIAIGLTLLAAIKLLIPAG